MFTRFDYDKTKYVLSGIKLKLFDINEECKNRLFELLGLSDYVYNWAIDKEEEYIKSQGLPLRDNSIKTPKLISTFDLQTLFIKERKSNLDMEFLNRLPIHIASYAFDCTINAFKRFYNRNFNHGYPRYKTKKKDRKKFGVRVDNCYIENGQLKIEGFTKRIRFNLNTNKFDNFGTRSGKCLGIKIVNPVISYDKNDFYISFSYLKEKEQLEDQISYDVIGIDLGIRKTFTISDGRVFQQPDCSRIETHISDTDRKISKCNKRRRKIAKKERTNLSNIPKSNNQLKLEKNRRKLYRKIHNKKTYFYHNVTTNLVKENHKAIVIEKIGVEKIKRQKPYMRKQLSQIYFYTIRNMFEYKSNKYNSLLIEANEKYASTKICNNCGELNHNIGSKKIFKCPCCGYVEDRDKNAADNLADLYYEYINGDYSNIYTNWIENYV